MSRKRKKLKHPKLEVSEQDVNETGLRVLKVLYVSGRPMSDRQLTERINFVWAMVRSQDAVWRSRKALVELELAEGSAVKDGRSVTWAITETGREFVRRYGYLADLAPSPSA